MQVPIEKNLTHGREDTMDIEFDIEELRSSGNWVIMFRYGEPIGIAEDVLREMREVNPDNKYRLMRVTVITKYKAMEVRDA